MAVLSYRINVALQRLQAACFITGPLLSKPFKVNKEKVKQLPMPRHRLGAVRRVGKKVMKHQLAEEFQGKNSITQGPWPKGLHKKQLISFPLCITCSLHLDEKIKSSPHVIRCWATGDCPSGNHSPEVQVPSNWKPWGGTEIATLIRGTTASLSPALFPPAEGKNEVLATDTRDIRKEESL